MIALAVVVTMVNKIMVPLGGYGGGDELEAFIK